MKKVYASKRVDGVSVEAWLPQYGINKDLTLINLAKGGQSLRVSLADVPALIETLQDLANQANEYLKTLDS